MCAQIAAGPVNTAYCIKCDSFPWTMWNCAHSRIPRLCAIKIILAHTVCAIKRIWAHTVQLSTYMFFSSSTRCFLYVRSDTHLLKYHALDFFTGISYLGTCMVIQGVLQEWKQGHTFLPFSGKSWNILIPIPLFLNRNVSFPTASWTWGGNRMIFNPE